MIVAMEQISDILEALREELIKFITFGIWEERERTKDDSKPHAWMPGRIKTHSQK